MSVNERILEILKSNKNLSQKVLAASIDVAPSTVNNWLKLGRSIPSEYIIPISEFLGVDVYFLLSGRNMVSELSKEDAEWISLIHKLPEETRRDLLGYLRFSSKLSAIQESTEEPLKKAK